MDQLASGLDKEILSLSGSSVYDIVCNNNNNNKERGGEEKRRKKENKKKKQEKEKQMSMQIVWIWKENNAFFLYSLALVKFVCFFLWIQSDV